MVKAVCIACGAAKGAPYRRCRHCGLDPTSDDLSLVKSVYLSTSRYVTGEETEDEIRNQREYSKELDGIADRLSRGDRIEYDEEELARLKENLDLMRSVPRAAVWGAVFRTFLPGFLFVAAIWLLYVLLQFL